MRAQGKYQLYGTINKGSISRGSWKKWYQLYQFSFFFKSVTSNLPLPYYPAISVVGLNAWRKMGNLAQNWDCSKLEQESKATCKSAIEANKPWFSHNTIRMETNITLMEGTFERKCGMYILYERTNRMPEDKEANFSLPPLTSSPSPPNIQGYTIEAVGLLLSLTAWRVAWTCCVSLPTLKSGEGEGGSTVNLHKRLGMMSPSFPTFSNFCLNCFKSHVWRMCDVWCCSMSRSTRMRKFLWIACVL